MAHVLLAPPFVFSLQQQKKNTVQQPYCRPHIKLLCLSTHARCTFYYPTVTCILHGHTDRVNELGAMLLSAVVTSSTLHVKTKQAQICTFLPPRLYLSRSTLLPWCLFYILPLPLGAKIFFSFLHPQMVFLVQ